MALAAALGFLYAPVALAQTPAPAAPASAPRKLISPFRGDASVEFTKPVTKRAGNNIVTTMVVKNTSPGPLAGFRIEESWSDKSGNLAGGDIYRHPRPLMPGDVITVTFTNPFNARMSSNSYNFIHANGNVKPKAVPKIEVPKTN
jgi:flagellar basal body L-ring protein FlgH